MKLFLSKNKTILHIINSPTSFTTLGYYKGERTGQVVLAYEINNANAVNMITEDKENSPATEEQLRERIKLVLQDLVKFASKNGVSVPGMDQMKQYFKI